MATSLRRQLPGCLVGEACSVPAGLSDADGATVEVCDADGVGTPDGEPEGEADAEALPDGRATLAYCGSSADTTGAFTVIALPLSNDSRRSTKLPAATRLPVRLTGPEEARFSTPLGGMAVVDGAVALMLESAPTPLTPFRVSPLVWELLTSVAMKAPLPSLPDTTSALST